MIENYYSVLGVSENATKDEIKKAYRSLQIKYHPDKNQSNQESMKMSQKINEAYETLWDERKKMEYDMILNGKMSFNSDMEVPIDELLNMFFGGNGENIFGSSNANIHVFHNGPMGANMLNKPTAILKTININIKQVLSGASIPLNIERWIIENGNKVFENETIYVTIPQGIDDNEMIILRGKGNVVNEHPSGKGDIKVIIKVTNDTEYKRSGLDILLHKTITLKESLCGFSFDMKYLNDKTYTLNIKKGNIIPPEHKKICPNMGLTRGDNKGNLIIHFHIEFPEKLTEEQTEKLIKIL